jgi:hypothetical protein
MLYWERLVVVFVVFVLYSFEALSKPTKFSTKTESALSSIYVGIFAPTNYEKVGCIGTACYSGSACKTLPLPVVFKGCI